jgi:excisionase family DNA binding protein
MAVTERKWLTAGDAAGILGVSVQTLRQWADEGKVRAFRTLGGHRRFRPEDIQVLQATFAGETVALMGPISLDMAVNGFDSSRRLGRRVLVIDEMATTRTMIRTSLERDGFTVEDVADVVQALAATSERTFDLILMDVRSTASDGWSVLGRLSRQSARSHTPVLMFSSSIDGPHGNGTYAVSLELDALLGRVRSLLS